MSVSGQQLALDAAERQRCEGDLHVHALGQLTDLTNRVPGGSLLSEFSGMSYDGTGNRLTQTNTLNGAPAIYSGTTTYQYDSKDQLTQESSTRFGGYTNGFVYDNAGNPTTFKGATNTFNSNNQNTANSYDLAGNPTTYGGTTLTFDAENRMTAYGTAMTAGYLAEGLRAWKQNVSGRTYFLYADGVIPVCEIDGSGNVVATNSIGEGGLLARHTSATAAYAFDPQGSASHRLDGSGNVLATSAFDA